MKKLLIGFLKHKRGEPVSILPNSYRQPPRNVAERDLWIDPDPQSTGLLLSDRIIFYAERVNLIYPFDQKYVEPTTVPTLN